MIEKKSVLTTTATRDFVCIQKGKISEKKKLQKSQFLRKILFQHCWMHAFKSFHADFTVRLKVSLQ